MYSQLIRREFVQSDQTTARSMNAFIHKATKLGCMASEVAEIQINVSFLSVDPETALIFQRGGSYVSN
jgi:hypothetical protein